MRTLELEQLKGESDADAEDRAAETLLSNKKYGMVEMKSSRNPRLWPRFNRTQARKRLKTTLDWLESTTSGEGVLERLLKFVDGMQKNLVKKKRIKRVLGRSR